MRYGYTTGVFDLYHADHAALLQQARARCDHLTVGLTTDGLAEKVKGRVPVIAYNERCQVLASVRWVDSIVPQTEIDKITAWQKLKYDVLFVGDDWYDSSSWATYETELKKADVPVIYIPTARNISSTQIRERLHG